MASNREIRIAADSVLALHRTLKQEVGAQAATVTLQKAGHAAGEALFADLGQDDPTGQTPHTTFWSQLSDHFEEHGWGTVEHEEGHPGVGVLVARDWFEIDPETAPTCPFSTGVLSNILGRVAGQDVAVMVVPCDEDDDGCCRFLFGSGPVLRHVYAGLKGGGELESALIALG